VICHTDRSFNAAGQAFREYIIGKTYMLLEVMRYNDSASLDSMSDDIWRDEIVE